MKLLMSLLFSMLAINSLVATNELQTVRALYLDLIKNVILNTIYEPDTAKENGSHWPKVAHTMIGKKRMENIQFCVEDILKNNVPGDLVETGVWRGGATIFMRAILKAYGDTQRIVWAADSFEGLPRPNASLYPADAQDTHYTIPFLSVSLPEVQANFKSYDLLDNQVRFLKGFFKDSITNCAISQIAVLRLDGDMYESTIQVLENLYDKVSIGGYIIIDDFTLPGARKATFDFRQARNITDPFIDIDGYSTYWKKSK